MNLLKIPQREFEGLCIQLLHEDCITCDMKVCHKSDCPFRNRKLGRHITFQPSVAKHWIYFFLWHTEYEWKFPTDENRAWDIHHKDCNHYNDSEENLELLTSFNHKSVHQNLNCNFNTEGKDGLVNSQRRAKEGIHHFQGDSNWQRHTERYLKVTRWLENLEGVCRVTKEVVKELNYNCTPHMIGSIKTIIEREFPNIGVTKIGSTKNCKWYVSKNK